MAGMLVLLSPSKTQDTEIFTPTELFTEPLFEEERWHLVRKIRECPDEEVKGMMKVSDNLFALHQLRSERWSKRHAQKDSKQAIHTFAGSVYSAFQDQTFTKKEYAYMQRTLRILSGLYGVIRPLDLIQPYRLEMGTRFSFTLKGTEYKNLYEYWSEPVTQYFCGHKERTIINLASVEYSKVIKRTACNIRFVEVEFLQKKGKELKQVTIYSKKERGTLALWIVRNAPKTPSDLQSYTENDYVYSKKLSKDNKLVFIRKHPS